MSSKAVLWDLANRSLISSMHSWGNKNAQHQCVKGFEYGLGFSGVSQRGSQQNDVFVADLRHNVKYQQQRRHSRQVSQTDRISTSVWPLNL